MDNNSSPIVSNIVNGTKKEVVVDIDKMLDELKPPPSSPPSSIFIVDTWAMDQDSNLKNEINEMLQESKPPPSSERCIYRVPMEVREKNIEAYIPRIVSIGPFHHDKKKLKSMEEVKQRYMKKLFQSNENSSLDNCFDFVKNSEEHIRDCYSECIEMDNRKFNIMVLVDSCFIIQFLISFYCDWENDDDHSLSLDQMPLKNIVLDLILLENQVPFFVLKELYIRTTFEEVPLLDLVLHFLSTATNLQLFEGSKILNSSELCIQSVKHFTHLVLILYQPPPKKWSPQLNERYQDLRSSATRLTDAGVKFKENRRSKGLFDITFTNEVLEITSLLLHDDTEILVRNLMALELCHDPKESFVTDYFIFMDRLINGTRDVNLLVDKKIIINNLGNNEAAADFFGKLCINVQSDPGNFYFSQVCKELNDYNEAPLHMLKVMLKHMKRYCIYTLKRDYCPTPWKAAATIGAIMLLVLTIIQTVCSIISVKDK